MESSVERELKDMSRRIEQLEGRVKTHADMTKELWVDMEDRTMHATDDFAEQGRMRCRLDHSTCQRNG